MHTVRAFNYVQFLWSDFHSRPQRKGGAVKRSILHGLSLGKRQQDFSKEALVVNVAACLGKALLSALLGTKEEIVHVEHIAVVDLTQKLRKRGFSTGAAAFDGDKRRGFFRTFRLDFRQKRQPLGVFFLDHAVGRSVGIPKHLRVMTGGKACIAPSSDFLLQFLIGKGQFAIFCHGKGDR